MWGVGGEIVRECTILGSQPLKIPFYQCSAWCHTKNSGITSVSMLYNNFSVNTEILISSENLDWDKGITCLHSRNTSGFLKVFAGASVK